MKDLSFLMAMLFIMPSAFSQTDNMIRISDSLELRKIGADVWIHISTVDMAPWGPVSANGLVVRSGSKLFLIDTPWTDALTAELINWFEDSKTGRFESILVTHSHSDNIGGLAECHRRGLGSYALDATIAKCREKGFVVPQNSIGSRDSIKLGGKEINVFFPGPGHTEDSLCAYLPGDGILFGGCSVKSLDNRNLGNTAEAYLEQWPAALENMRKEFPDAKIVVPGHGREGSQELIEHTLSLFD